MPYHGFAMQNSLTLGKAVRKKETHRKSGTLSLFSLESQPDAPPSTYARFRVCRGFIDDLNRILPIRLRIQLEAEVEKGHAAGQVGGSTLRFRWEYLEG